MKKRLCVLLAASLLFCSLTPAAMAEKTEIDAPATGPAHDQMIDPPEDPPQQKPVHTPTKEEKDAITVYVDGKKLTHSPAAVLSEETTFVPLQIISFALGADMVQTDEESGYVMIRSKGLKLIAKADEKLIMANGRCIYVPTGFKTVNGSLYVPVRVLCKAFGAQVEWDGYDSVVYITTSDTPIESAEAFYDENDLYWLSHIVHAEAGNDTLEGMIAVANVVLNRLNNPRFPDTIYGVVFDNSAGIQFTPAYSGSIYLTPSDTAVLAAKLALDGANVAGDSLYFNRAGMNSWAAKNCILYGTIGYHDFYK